EAGAVDEDLCHLRRGRWHGSVALRVDAIAGAVLVVARPGDDEVALGVGRDRGLTAADGQGVDAELAALRHAGGVVAMGVDAFPGDDDVPFGVGRNGGVEAGGGGVDAELPALRNVRGVVALGIDAIAEAVLVPATPRDHEVPVGVGCNRWVALVAGGEGVHAELAALGDAGGTVALREHVVAGRGDEAVARPGDDEVAVGGGRDGGVPLVPIGGGVHEELAAPGHAGGVIAPGEDAPSEAVLLEVLPGDDEVTVGIGCDGGVLVAGGGGFF